ncbi:geranylgeranyl pyrophosphate synthetase [Colletotrichum kahawae]|uniref:Geranylgeranyl pyrophosphate synthetase n=1 Tax=Colletotrichum kahawae TaxID=34407 RepID=A0AAD9Y729_COLKA|nr:geranylgeranyl pyrophosphate synthetase [Colletotrichum kahawae]
MFRRNNNWQRPQRPNSGLDVAAPPFGPLIESIAIADLAKSASKYSSSAAVTDCEVLASYNWLDRAQPTMKVPGAPPRWTPLSAPRQLHEDSGVYYRDKNAARYSSHPMEPAVRAILTMQPDAPTKEVHIVACGSTLGNLLRFVRRDERAFRMLVEVVGNTVHLIRRENSPTATIPDVQGYGHTFPEAYTTWDADVRGSASHQRILRYQFGGLGCIVRHEGDGYLKDQLGSTTQPKRERGAADPVEDLVASLADNNITSKTPATSSQLQMLSGGFEVPQSAVFDLKTRSSVRRGRDFLGEELPRMWVAQIPNFVLAYHNRGVFNDIEVIDVSSKLKDWEREQNNELSQLAALLHRIVDVAQANHRLEIAHRVLGKLEVLKQTPGLPALCSAGVLLKWIRWLGTAGTVMYSSDGEYDSDVRGGELDWSDSDNDDRDFTACSQECAYCGRCTY